MELKEKLIQLRKEKGLSQLELAEAVNVSRQAVSRWENGLSVPSIDKLRGLSELYGVSLDSLLCAEIEKINQQSIGQPEVAADVTESRENIQALHKHRKALLWLAGILCVAVLLAIILLSSQKRKDKEDNYFIMSEIEPTEDFSESSENFSFTW